MVLVCDVYIVLLALRIYLLRPHLVPPHPYEDLSQVIPGTPHRNAAVPLQTTIILKPLVQVQYQRPTARIRPA